MNATDLAEDLRHWSAPPAAGLQSPALTKIVPKGLRSFDAADSDFFLELLPGPRDRNGLPETLVIMRTPSRGHRRPRRSVSCLPPNGQAGKYAGATSQVILPRA